MNSHQIRRAAVDGALAWLAYAAVEIMLAGPVRWWVTDPLEYRMIHPLVNVSALLIYPLFGALAGSFVALITRGRLVANAGLLVLPLSLAAESLRHELSWAVPVAAYGLVLGAAVVASEVHDRSRAYLSWVCSPWWVAIMVAGVPMLRYEFTVGMPAMVRLLWIAGFAAAIPAIAAAVSRRRPVPQSPRRRLVTTVAAAVVVLGISFVPEQSVRSAPITAAVRPGRRPNVILITLDTIRADHVSLYGYERDTTPNLRRLATDSTVYTRAVAPSDMTLPSIASLFTGVYPSRHGAHFATGYKWGRPFQHAYPTIAELLRDKGYYTAAIAANTYYMRHSYELDRGFLYFDNRWCPTPLMWENGAWLRAFLLEELKNSLPMRSAWRMFRPASAITDAASELIEQANAKSRSFFLFLNYMDAHYPCAPPAPYADAFPGRDPDFTHADWESLRTGVLRFQRQVTPAERAHLFAQYDGAILYLDSELNRLFQKLRALGIYDDTMVIVASDHGEAMGERNYFEHAGLGAYQFLVGVPLVVKYPHSGHRGVIEDPVSLVDIPPTILETLGYEPPPHIDGRCLLRSSSREEEAILSEVFPGEDNAGLNARYTRSQRAIYSGKLKFIKATDGSRELYDLSQDPRELKNLYPVEAAAARSLEASLSQWLAAYLPRETRSAHLPANAAADRLRSLGYLQ